MVSKVLAVSGGNGAAELVSGYQAWWEHDEGTGLAIADSSPSGCGGLFSGASAQLWQYDGPDSNAVGTYLGGALDFTCNIGNGNLQAGSADDASMTFTMCFYAREVHASSTYCVISKYDDGSTGNWKFIIESSGLKFQYLDGSPTTHSFECAHTVVASTWYIYTLAVYFDATGAHPQWYIGASAVSGGWPSGGDKDPTGQTDYVIIGGVDDGGDDGGSGISQNLNALVGDIVVYDTYLASSDVDANNDVLKTRYSL